MRKTVTVVFSDLKGSTALGERLDPEAVREVLGRYFEAMRGELERHGGTVEKYIGDAIMAVFGLPRLHEDDALRAVRAAAGMQRALAVLNEELQARWGVQLANRTGVNTGEVVAGDPTASEHLVTGDAVNTAARLSVEGEEGLARRLDLPLVGREADLARLLDAFRQAVAEPRCRLVTVVADAGVGKSRLAEEVARRGRAEALVLRGRCLAYGEGITFWPLVEIVRSAASIHDDDPREAARAKLAALAGDGEVAERLAAAVGLSPAPFALEELFWPSASWWRGWPGPGPWRSSSTTSTGPSPPSSTWWSTWPGRSGTPSFSSSAWPGPTSSTDGRAGAGRRTPSFSPSLRSRPPRRSG